MNPVVYLAQRVTAAVLALAVAVHLATILYAIHGGLTAGDILARTRGNGLFLAFYLTFVIAAAIHAPLGLRSVLREWTGWKDQSLDYVLVIIAATLVALGMRAAIAVYLA